MPKSELKYPVNASFYRAAVKLGSVAEMYCQNRGKAVGEFLLEYLQLASQEFEKARAIDCGEKKP